MNRRRVMGGGAVLAVMLAALAWWWLTHRAAPSHKTAAVSPNVATAVARIGDFDVRVAAQGRVGAPAGSSAKLSFAEAGIVKAVNVRVGERVTAGTPLAELDRAALGTAVVQAGADAGAAADQYANGALPQAAIRSAQAKAEAAAAHLRSLERGGPAATSDEIAAQQAARQASLKVMADRSAVARDRTLLAGGVIAAKDLDAAQSQLAGDLADQRSTEAKALAAAADYSASLKSARADDAAARSELAAATAQAGVLGAQVDASAAKLAAAKIAYEQGVLRAPQDGIVIAVLRHAGEAVDPASPAIELGPGEAGEVTLTVPAQQARTIRPGDPAVIQMPQSALGAPGRVSAVVPAVDPLTQAAIVTVSGVPADALPGDAVSVTIVTAHIRGVLLPSTAVVEDPQTGKTVAFLRKSDGSFVSREIVVRASDARSAVIASGLKAGERVATRGAYELLAPPGG